MLINLTNHPYSKWSEIQRNKANELYGVITDLNFPKIDPTYSKEEVHKLCNKYFAQIMDIFDLCANSPNQNAVHIQGEFTFVFKLVYLLKNIGISCVASTTERNVKEIDGKKIVEFNFVQFREY